MSWVDDFTDNLELAVSVASDAADVRNWWNGTAPNTARTVEEQMAEREGRAVDQGRIDRSAEGGLARIGDAAGETVDQVVEKAKDAGTFLGKWGPWILGGVALVVVGVVALPYVGAAKELAS